jgi:hypothetical protein
MQIDGKTDKYDSKKKRENLPGANKEVGLHINGKHM